MVSWLPLHHDMGLIGGLLTSIYCAAETCLMPPLTFLGRPVTWLEAITHCAATLTVAPTFAYSLCARKIPDKQLDGIDLSSLRLAYVGAEPIDAATSQAFVAALHAVRPVADGDVPGLRPRRGDAGGGRFRRPAVRRATTPSTGAGWRRRHRHPRRRPSGEGVTFVSVGQPLPRHRVEIRCRDSGDAARASGASASWWSRAPR